MRILVSAGYARSLIRFRGPLLREFTKAGHLVLACAPEEDISTQHELAEIGVSYRRVPFARAGLSPIGDLWYLYRMILLIHKFRPEIVLAYTHKPVVFGLLAGRICGVPERFGLITGLGYVFIDGRDLGRRIVKSLMRVLYRVALKNAQYVLFQNPDDEAEFRQQGMMPRGVPACITNGSGVDLESFAPSPAPTPPISFLLIARLLWDKGIGEFVEAAKRVKALHPECHFDLVGPTDPNPSGVDISVVRRWAQEGITYHGETEDVRPYLRRTSVYVLPSYREGTPRSVLEAMAMARPIITTDTPGCRGTIDLTELGSDHCSTAGVVRGRNGFLVPVRNVDGLVEAMLSFIREPDLVVTMGVASRCFAKKEFDVVKVNRKILDCIGLA